MAQTFPVAEVTPSPQTGRRFVAIFIASSLALLVDGTANFAISSGLPYIQGAIGTTPDESSWILTAFNAPYYSAILLSPWLYARFGRKPLLLVSMAIFALVSLALALTPPFGLALGLRAMQGAALGCVFVPAGILLFTSFPLNRLALGIPWFALVALGGSAIGSLIGGFLSETYGAGAVYIPSALAILICFGLIWAYAPNRDAPQPRLRFDGLGVALGLALFGAAQYLANEGERRNWFDSPSVAVAAVVLVVSAAGFVLWEFRLARNPHANLHLFGTYRNLSVGAIVNVALGAAGYSIVLFSAYLQSATQATATLAGGVIAVRLLTYVVGIAAAFILVSRRFVDVRIVVGIAAVATAACFVAFSLGMTSTADAASFIAVSLVLGLVFSMMSQPVPSLVVGSLPLQHLPAGLSVYKLSAPVGLMIATAFLQTTIDRRAAFYRSQLAAGINRSRVPIAEYLAHGGSLRNLEGLVGSQAQTLAFRDATIVLAMFVLLVAPVVAFAATRPREPEVK